MSMAAVFVTLGEMYPRDAMSVSFDEAHDPEPWFGVASTPGRVGHDRPLAATS